MQPEDSLPPFPILSQMNPVHNLLSSKSDHFILYPSTTKSCKVYLSVKVFI